MLLEPPLPTPRLTEVLQWHRYREDDPGVRWVREQIIALAEVMPAI
jgi:DNA-binding transcriptional LysR family regulator